MTKRFIYSLFLIFIIFFLAGIIIIYGRGYRINLQQKTFSTTGILSASSYPDKASIWIDGKLISATNSSISLQPKWYDIKITKEGYQSWEKRINIKGEIVSQIDALLIPNNPSLKSITQTGIENPVLSPSGLKVVYIIPLSKIATDITSKTKSGVWLLDLRAGPLGRNSDAKLLFQGSATYDWKNTHFNWAPDEKTIILEFYKIVRNKEIISKAFELDTETENTKPVDITFALPNLLSKWTNINYEKEHQSISLLPQTLEEILQKSVSNIKFSTDETKILYLATNSATLNRIIDPPLIGTNSTEEARNLKSGNWYVYDKKEDKNYLIIPNTDQNITDSITWYTDSKHIIMIDKAFIYIIDYDGANKRTVYSGPFEDNIVYASPAGNKLIILANLNKLNGIPNLYELDLR